MKNMYFKVSVATLLAFLVLFSVAVPAESQSAAFLIKGYVNVDGVPMNGVHVSSNGISYNLTRNDANGNPGSYALMPPGVTNGSQVTINFEYNGHTTSVMITADGNSTVAPVANIVTHSSTPTPTPANNGGSSGSGGSGWTAQTTQTPTPTPTITPTPTPTIQPTITPTPTPTPISTPSTTPATSNTPVYLVIGAIAVIVIAAAVYLLLKKK